MNKYGRRYHDAQASIPRRSHSPVRHGSDRHVMGKKSYTVSDKNKDFSTEKQLSLGLGNSKEPSDDKQTNYSIRNGTKSSSNRGTLVSTTRQERDRAMGKVDELNRSIRKTLLSENRRATSNYSNSSVRSTRQSHSSSEEVNNFMEGLQLLLSTNLSRQDTEFALTLIDRAKDLKLKRTTPFSMLSEQAETFLRKCILEHETRSKEYYLKRDHERIVSLLCPILEKYSYGINLEELDVKTCGKSLSDVIDGINKMARTYRLLKLSTAATAHIYARVLMKRNSKKHTLAPKKDDSFTKQLMIPKAPPAPNISSYAFTSPRADDYNTHDTLLEFEQEYPAEMSHEQDDNISEKERASNIQKIVDRIKYIFEKNTLPNPRF